MKLAGNRRMSSRNELKTLKTCLGGRDRLDFGTVRPRPTCLQTGPCDAPDSPERRRVGERIAMHEEEVCSAALSDLTCFWLVENLARFPGDRRERLPWFEPCLGERLHLPCELVPGARAAAET